MARAEFEQRIGGNPDDKVPYIQRDWFKEAEEMLVVYNKIVKILVEKP